MYVCVCKGVTCRQIRTAVQERAVGSLRELSRDLGVATQCGKCAGCARRILHEALDESRCAAVAECSMAPVAAA